MPKYRHHFTLCVRHFAVHAPDGCRRCAAGDPAVELTPEERALVAQMRAGTYLADVELN